MPTHPILIDGEWRAAQNPADTFASYNPSVDADTDDRYPVSGWEDLDALLNAAVEAVVALRQIAPHQIALFLDRYADEIEADKDALIAAAHTETALPDGTRLPGELSRTTRQLRQAAEAARDGSWAEATLDTETNIRSMLQPLGGPVVVFGPNNFPLAFNGISGGDFAAAIAAGNPVIAKANPGHPRTTQLLAEAALRAMTASGMPTGLVGMFYHTPNENGLKLVADPRVGATAFTGSKAGLHLKRAADEAGKPIYLEMSSVNPVVILPGVLDERADALAAELAASCMLGAGQFCTNPGLVFLMASDTTEAFVGALAEHLSGTEPDIMLTAGSTDALAEGLAAWRGAGAEPVTGGERADGPNCFQPTLMRASGADFLADPAALQTEAFGAASLVVVVDDLPELLASLAHLEGNLTGCVYSDTGGADDDAYRLLAPVLQTKVGRLLNDKMPTGVAVVPSMVHGGPFPATGHPGFTAVGIPAALRRFAKLTSYDNVRAERLPPELRDNAPHPAIWRLIDGVYVQG